MNPSLPNFGDTRVLVVGDVMLDSYWHGETERISPEAPVPVVHVRNVEKRPGGAANVAFNIAALGAKPILVGVTGDDESADLLSAMLGEVGVDFRGTRVADMPTVTKMRVISRHQQLIRLDIEEPRATLAGPEILAQFDSALDQVDAVVLSDYGKGVLAAAQEFIGRARAKGMPVFVDPKGTDFTRYAGATAITPNLAEFERVVGALNGDAVLLAERAEALRSSLSLEALLVTQGEHGMTLVRAGRPAEHVAAHALEVFDVTGAGDTVIGVFAAAVAAGEEMDSAMRIANLAAGVVVGKLGAATASVAEIEAEAHAHRAGVFGVLDEDALLSAVASARAAGERVVMTNGCFDLLHAGHADYLSRARAMGDRLLVAVNDDASVRGLKGEGRPVNSLQDRMAVLAALSSVDWVVSFSEETPARIISRLLPDVLVKGGDYGIEEIAGADAVRNNGGRVEIIPLLPGRSTTRTIEAVLGAARRLEADDAGS
ncbi:MAG: bifunctional D-glycero-beta-D-manno-heptose-7-phosphate kinase/D-glycero-beta-D-manno-heptose 1-phosphate adenylyltransferase HldE [Gammaproteobacteria bacterium]|nr:bifunctional D-glycero-beta-D-manno-heptose-7-phosphate kinase/D-glycero-beta-D-manno-heptose 1-phosphate adenylyltransferase HldE [Gammaproteobacteria bacterium]MDH3413217.1 bifunctional D-glycero-beta-D-manno-heptose-7-phosphate kinase/D-glycero-beta-D-manno-heptose 1-phosphate adenylyltransferase HldE [Gammaproteobacteria bacterium]